jgi:hypothetical protein
LKKTKARLTSKQAATIGKKGKARAGGSIFAKVPNLLGIKKPKKH